MTDNFNAIETEYDGYRFRSRREARWAVFLDSCHADWEYEPEGFELEGGLRYLPDFLIHDVLFIHGIEWADGIANLKGNDLWMEVKKDNPDQRDMEKIEKFCGLQFEERSGMPIEETLKNRIIMVGNIPKGNNFDDLIRDMEKICYDKEFYNFTYVDGDYFGAFPGITKKGQFALFGDDSSYTYYADEKRTYDAYRAAQQARFEWGESPMVAN